MHGGNLCHKPCHVLCSFIPFAGCKVQSPASQPPGLRIFLLPGSLWEFRQHSKPCSFVWLSGILTEDVLGCLLLLMQGLKTAQCQGRRRSGSAWVGALEGLRKPRFTRVRWGCVHGPSPVRADLWPLDWNKSQFPEIFFVISAKFPSYPKLSRGFT